MAVIVSLEELARKLNVNQVKVALALEVKSGCTACLPPKITAREVKFPEEGRTMLTDYKISVIVIESSPAEICYPNAVGDWECIQI